MAWGKEWPNSLAGKAIAERIKQEPEHPVSTLIRETGEALIASLTPIGIGIDLGAGDSQTVLTTFDDGKIGQRIISSEELYAEWHNASKDLKEAATVKVYNNQMPTHDPYTNPNAQLYYECKCGAILDPGTKSFAALNNAASDKGWKVRWRKDGMGYEPFCVECGKDVE